MATQRVTVLSNGSLLMASVLSLLQGVDALDVSSVSATDAEAPAAIAHLAPDVVVLDGDGAGDQALIAQVLTRLPRARVVTVDLGRTDIGVYRTRRIARASLDGLLLAIGGRAAHQRGLARGDRRSAVGTTEVRPMHDDG
jgi:hypothetical protein